MWPDARARLRISSDFDSDKEPLRGFPWMRDNDVGAIMVSAISWIQRCIHMERSKEPVCAMWYNGLKRITSSFGLYVGGLAREDLDCHLVSISPSAASCDVIPPAMEQGNVRCLKLYCTASGRGAFYTVGGAAATDATWEHAPASWPIHPGFGWSVGQCRGAIKHQHDVWRTRVLVVSWRLRLLSSWRISEECVCFAAVRPRLVSCSRVFPAQRVCLFAAKSGANLRRAS